MVGLCSDCFAICASFVETVCGLNVPSCLSLAQTSCPALPSRAPSSVIVGPLGLGSPRVRAGVAPCPAVLCVATTAFVLSGRCALCSLPVPWVDALCLV